MRTITTIVLVSLGLLGLSACDAPRDGGSSGDRRARLNIVDGYGEFGEYVLHVNGMTSTELTPEIAQAYGIVRSENRGIINLAVMRKGSDGGANTPVTADVKISAANLTGQLKPVKAQEIREGDAIYYVGEVSIDDREMINFDLDIRPEGEPRVLKVRFSQQFYTR